MAQAPAQHRSPDLDRIVIYAVVGAVALLVGDVLLDVVTSALDGREIAFGDVLKSQLTGIASDVGLLGGAVLVFQVGGAKTGLLRGAGLAYAGWVVDSVLVVILYDFAEFDLTSLVWDLHGPLLIVAFAMVVRLYDGRTILPGVDVRL